jgi:hypothetical protein
MHAPDKSWPAGLLDIDLAFAQIVSRDEEGGFGTIRRENIQEMRREVEWTVVECQCYCALLFTMRNSISFVSDIADQWPGHVERRLAQRPDGRIATVRIIGLTIWTRAVLVAPAAEAHWRTAMKPISLHCKLL